MTTLLLEKLLILTMLFDDDEPLNLILEEALITEENKGFLNKKFQNEQITIKNIKCALEELRKCNMVELLSENGEKLGCDDSEFSQILESDEEWKYWFRITKSGKRFFDDNQQTYFREGSFN